MKTKISDCGQTRAGIRKCVRQGCYGTMVYRIEGNFWRCALCGNVEFDPPGVPLVELGPGWNEWR